MKLYYSPGACALASQIVLREAGVKFDLVKVDLGAKRTADGGDFLKINPKGYVPALQDDNGQVYTEGTVILQRLADQVPDKNLMPKFGTAERYHAMEWLNFVATELHKGFSGLFNKAFNDDSKKAIIDRLHVRLAFLENHLKTTGGYMLGSEFSAVDAYVFNILRWAPGLKVDLSPYTAILGLMERVKARPSARASIEGEGLRA